MFNFFCNLALSIYYGSWVGFDNGTIILTFNRFLSAQPIFNIFNNSVDVYYVPTSTNINLIPDMAMFIAVILSTICCISVFFIIVKAVKKLFTCFLEW